VQSAVVILAIGILAIIAYGDLRRRRIPNELSLAIAILGLTRMLLGDDAVAAGPTLAAAAAVFVAAFLLFWRGILGGGDAKLVARARQARPLAGAPVATCGNAVRNGGHGTHRGADAVDGALRRRHRRGRRDNADP